MMCPFSYGQVECDQGNCDDCGVYKNWIRGDTEFEYNYYQCYDDDGEDED